MSFLKETLLLKFYLLLINISFLSSQNFHPHNNPYKASAICVRKEIAIIDSILRSKLPIRFLESDLIPIKEAQYICVQDSIFTQHIINQDFNVINRCEFMSVSKLSISDINPEEIINWNDVIPYRVEMFNFALNITTIALVDVLHSKLISVNHYKNIQPEIPERLRALAVEIAINSKEVQEALSFKPLDKDALMSSTKTALNRTKCERSHHLCVAPTFIKGEKALWAVVDLTDLRLVGIQWTYVGKSNELNPLHPSEKTIQNKRIKECYCDKINQHQDKLWKFNYSITSSDGLKISEVFYNNDLIIQSAKLVDWHVSYSPTEQFGYSDAVGCPLYSSAVVIAIKDPEFQPIIETNDTIGFSIIQYFASDQWPNPCNYNYAQKYDFYYNGDFRMAAASLGRGCGNNGTYRPVFRIHFNKENQNFYHWQNDSWNQWHQEKFHLQTEYDQLFDSKYLYKINLGLKNTIFIEPSFGQFGDGGRGDNAYTYITRHKNYPDEGELDLPTIGPCCNSDYMQGPEKFIDSEPESITNSEIIFWYVPQMKNDNTPGREYCWADRKFLHGIPYSVIYPCYAGPYFKLVSNP